MEELEEEKKIEADINHKIKNSQQKNADENQKLDIEEKNLIDDDKEI